MEAIGGTVSSLSFCHDRADDIKNGIDYYIFP